MAEANKNALAYSTETSMWRLLRQTNIAVVEPQNELAGARAPTVPDESDVQVLMKHEFSETFERDKFDGKFVHKGELHNIVNHLCNSQSHIVF